MRKIAIPMILVLALMFTMGAMSKNEKVDICHVTGNDSYHVINISINALQAHLSHGDALYVNEICQWLPEPPAPIVFITSYYIPIMFQFFDWDNYCFPRCPLYVDMSGNAINAYP